MNIYLLGSTGMLGSCIHKYFRSRDIEITCLNRKHFDATEPVDWLRDLITEGDIIINSVGILKPYVTTIGRADTIKINALFPQLVSDVCDELKAKMLNISTDCVFTGAKGNYIESDICDARDLYGITKSIDPPNAMCLRTSFIGEETTGVGLIKWLIENKNNTIQGYTNCLWNGLTCLQFAKYIYDIILNHKYIPELRHVYSPTIVSKYELCSIINEVYDLNIEIEPVTTESITGTTVNGVLDRTLSSKYKLPHTLPVIRQQIQEQYEFMRTRI